MRDARIDWGVYGGIEKRVKMKVGSRELLNPVESDDVALPIEFNGDRCSFLRAVQRAFPQIRRVGLFTLWGPEPDTRPIRSGEF